MIRNIAVVSLSRGVLGEAFAQHEVEIGLQRLAGYGVNVRFMPNARRGIDYLTLSLIHIWQERPCIIFPTCGFCGVSVLEAGAVPPLPRGSFQQ